MKKQITFFNTNQGDITFHIDGKEYKYYVADWGLLIYYSDKWKKTPMTLLNWVKKNDYSILA